MKGYLLNNDQICGVEMKEKQKQQAIGDFYMFQRSDLYREYCLLNVIGRGVA